MQLDLCWGASQQAGAAGFDIRGPARNIELVNCIAIGNSQEGVRISDGASSIGVVGGEVVANSQEAASFNGINVINGLGLLLKNPDDREPIRCGVAHFHHSRPRRLGRGTNG